MPERPPTLVSHLLRDREQRRVLAIVLGTALVSMLVYYGMPAGINELARRTAAIFVVAAVFWATEVIPLYATSLCVIALEIVFLAHDGGLAGSFSCQSEWPVSDGVPVRFRYGEFFSSFSSPIIILFLGGFLLSVAVSKNSIDRAIAARFLAPLARRPFLLLLSLVGMTAFLSMWMSNTATASMMLALIAPLLVSLPSEHPFGRALVLGVAFGANVGGMGTPIGTPPNAVALASLRMAGYDISFVDWMLLGVPLAAVLVVVVTVLLYRFYPPTGEFSLRPIQAPTRPLGVSGRLTIAVLCLATVLWLTEGIHGLASSVVALFAATALTALRVLDREDVDSINWNVLILMWGGLSLGHAMQITGLAGYVEEIPLESLGPFGLAALVVVLAATLSTFMSNTASATLIVPMAMAFSPEGTGSLAILAAFGCSCGMAMPVSTPPNAIAFASGRVPVRSLLRVGGILTLLAVLLLLAGFRLLMPWILGR